MASLQSSAFKFDAHRHVGGEHCPWCDQAIPREKFAEIAERIAAREREQHARMTLRLKEDMARERAEGEARVREEERQRVEARMGEQLAAIEARRAEAEALLRDQRELADKEKTVAVLAEQARAFEEKQKLHEKLIALQKQLENRTAQDLGEGPEADLFELLRGAFEGDRIRRVAKGLQGADVIHEVMSNGRPCGKIVYDSKNRNAWKSEFVTKLRADQMAEQGDHAVLSSNKFPAGAQQLHLVEGVIVAHPARVLAIAQVLRAHLLQVSALRISNDQRDEKTVALYDFMTSERCRQLFGAIEGQAVKLAEIDAAEEKAHRLTWERRSKVIRSVQKVHGDLTFEIDRVIGTATAEAPDGDPMADLD